jgi:XTP/dITP diphosphohydrolase
MKLLIATRNPDKLKEFRQILDSANYQLLSLDQIKSIPQDFDVKETGSTFKQNAILKAKTYGQKTQLLTVADDSGLMIDHLRGFPGVNSARFAQGSFQSAMQRILGKLKNVSQSKRTAKFVSLIALYHPQTKETHTFTGECHGWIAPAPQGTRGFGYDPIFLSKDLNKTFGQVSPKQKNQISHRAQALKKLKVFLSQSPIE